ncbi:hypothetical protein PMSD_20465 [Paenibacillus macquariensis subsp. defensor]|nr:hypothetical protein PMSD_20465 [Paenibacillus macquariensis subsp. defensor]
MVKHAGRYVSLFLCLLLLTTFLSLPVFAQNKMDSTLPSLSENRTILSKETSEGLGGGIQSDFLTRSTTVIDDNRLLLDKTLLGLGNRLLDLSEKAYKQNNILMSKALDQKYYDLLQKNIAIHQSNSNDKLYSNVESFRKETGINTLEKDVNQLIREYETTINTYYPVKPRSMSLFKASYPNIVLDKPFTVDNNVSTVYEFTPPTYGEYQFSIDAYDQNQGYDTDLLVYYSDDSNETIATRRNIITDLKSTYSATFEGGHKYILEILNSGDEPRSIVTVNKIPAAIYLNKPIDVSLQPGQFTVFTFNPSLSFNYRILTGPYGGFGMNSGANIEIYSDKELSNLIASGEEACQECISAEVEADLLSGNTYYIKLLNEPNYSDRVHTRIQIVKNNNTNEDLMVGIPIDIDVQGDTHVLSFIPPRTGDYNILTDYFGGINNDEYYPPYTVVSVYDERLYELFGSGYGGVSLHLNGGKTYYIKINDYSGNVKVRAIVRAIATTMIFPNTAYDIIESLQSAKGYVLRPSSSGKYVFWTSPYGGKGKDNDTILELYSDSELTTLVASNDNSNNTVFSRIETNLIEGTTYYLVLKARGPLNTRFMFASFKDSIRPTNLSITQLTATSAVLTWKSPPNNTYVREYQIYNGSKLIGVVTNGVTSYSITGPSVKFYNFTVKAKDAAGNLSDASNVIKTTINLQYNYEFGRLKNTTVKDTNQIFQTYNYDNNGNLLSVTFAP